MSQSREQISVTECANALRVLAMDAVEQAKSGHPGAPMGMADIATTLWRRHLKHNPSEPCWANRDRFILSNGHGSMLIYALLHLSGYDLPIEQLKAFRQLHSKTPGHPEVGVTPGVETTTGPLGQGLANGVGMALTEKMLAAEFNRPDLPLVDHHTYVFVGDGCLMEGISHEACSFAGTLRLSKLVVFYDDNGISIDGHVEAWFNEDVAARFRAYGWHVIDGVDGHDAAAIDAALVDAKRQGEQVDGKPSLIVCKTVIGKGSPNKAGTHDVHGAPLGSQEIAATRAALNWPHPPFVIPEAVKMAWDARASGAKQMSDWQALFDRYTAAYPEAAAEFTRRMRGDLPSDFAAKAAHCLSAAASNRSETATRKSSQQALDQLVPLLPEVFGGSADLTGSNLTLSKASKVAARDTLGNHLSYGVREFAMAAMMNGMALHGGYIPYGGTFLTFSDYSRNAIRMSALMRLRVIHVMTHDSIGLGEDGPTHQSVEHVPSLRLIPGLDVWRPADGLETMVAWLAALERRDGPSLLVLSRQNLPQLATADQAEAIAKGGYILSPAEAARVVLLATGSEVSLAMDAQQALAEHGVAAQVVSMPCTSRFDQEPQSYRERVIPPGLPVVAIEAAQPDTWWRYLGGRGRVIGMHSFGESAPASELYRYFGITSEAVVKAALELVTPLR